MYLSMAKSVLPLAILCLMAYHGAAAGASGCCYEYKEDVNTGHSESYCNTESKEIVTQNDCPGEYAIHMPIGFLSFARSSFLSTRECMHG